MDDCWPETVLFKSFPNREALTDDLSESIASELCESITSQGAGCLIVSGGSTPKPLFQSLAVTDIPWDKVKVSLADERFVPPTHPDSNERLLRESLLTGFAASANLISLYHERGSAKEAAEESDQQIKSAKIEPDVLILGMGNDGHTASLFPGSPLLKQGLDDKADQVCLPMTPQDAPHDRITLTAAFLGKSRRKILHIVGEDKLETLKKACAGDDVMAMPIRYFLQHSIEVYWSP